MAGIPSIDALWPALTESRWAMVAVLFLLACIVSELLVRLTRLHRYAALAAAGLALSALTASWSDAPVMPLLGAWLEAVGMLMLFELGQRVSFEWLQKNPWLLAESLIESIAVFAWAYYVMRVWGQVDGPAAAVAASIAMVAAPIVIMAVSKELRSRGQVTERALLFGTLSTAYAALVLQLVLSGAMASGGVDLARVMLPIYQLCGAFLLGALGAGLMMLFVRVVPGRGAVQIMAVAALCALLYVSATVLQISPLLCALAFGLVTRGVDHRRRVMAFELSEAGTLLAMAFFVLTGAAIDWRVTTTALVLAVALIAGRVLIKLGAALVFASPSGLSVRKGALVGATQVPQSGMALLLAAHVSTHYPALANAVQPIVAAVLLLLLLGPGLMHWALRYAREDTAFGGQRT